MNGGKAWGVGVDFAGFVHLGGAAVPRLIRATHVSEDLDG
jgi:hypothetical protein